MWKICGCLGKNIGILKISRIQCQSTFAYLQQGHRQDSLNDTFWLMTFFESACFIASQMFANWIIGNSMVKNTAPSFTIIFLATICFTFLARGWTETPGSGTFKEYSLSFYSYIFGGKFTCFTSSCLFFFPLYQQFHINIFEKTKLNIIKNEVLNICMATWSLSNMFEHSEITKNSYLLSFMLLLDSSCYLVIRMYVVLYHELVFNWTIY